MQLLQGLPPEDAYTAYEIQDFWQQLLFKWEFPSWLIDYASEKHYKWTTIIRNLHDRRATVWRQRMLVSVAQLDQARMLRTLTVMAMTESEDSVLQEQLRLSLLLDGIEISGGQIVSIEGPISVTREKSRLLKNLESSSFVQKDVIAKHLKDAEDLFADGKMHPAMGEARSAFQAGIEDTVTLVEAKVQKKSGAGVGNQIEFLSKHDLLSPDEDAAFRAAWGFLSAGAHPGLPQDESGRIGLIFGLEFLQVLLLKAKTLV